MDIQLEQMGVAPDRDAEFFCHAEVVDDAGQRYPVRLLTDSVVTACVRVKLKVEKLGPIVDLAYRQIIERLIEAGELKPGFGHLNWIYVSDGGLGESRQGEVVVGDGEKLLLTAAEELAAVKA